jgi:hypothetical protein
MTDAIIDATNIDTSVFAYTAPKAHAAGGKVVNLCNKNFRESLTLSTPMILTWGAQEGKDQQGNFTGKWTMSLQFPNKDFPNEECELFLENMIKLEKAVKRDAITHSKEWFGKSITSEDVMEEKFNVMLRYPKIKKGSLEMDYSKPPTLTAKLPCWKDVWQSEIYDEDGEPLFLKNQTDCSPLEYLKPRSHVICLIQCGGLWFVNGKVSITWNLKQAVVQKPKVSSITEGTCFLKPKASDKEKFKELAEAEENETSEEQTDNNVSSVVVEDSDDEQEENKEPELRTPTPTPTPPPVEEKKVTKKKQSKK